MHVRTKIKGGSMMNPFVLRDIFTTLLEGPWSHVLAFGALLYTSLWFFFGVLYYFLNNEKMPGCKPSQVRLHHILLVVLCVYSAPPQPPPLLYTGLAIGRGKNRLVGRSIPESTRAGQLDALTTLIMSHP